MKRYSMARKKKVIDMLGGKCVDCGDVNNLDVHHVDPTTKSFTLADGWHHAWAKILVEAKKCVLLCKPCHIKRHESKSEHGTAQRYWRGCRCESCAKANSDYRRSHKRGLHAERSMHLALNQD